MPAGSSCCRCAASELPGKAALDALVGEALAELAAIGQRDDGAWRHVEIESDVDDRRILGEWSAGDAEGKPAGKGKRRDRRDVAEGVPPAERAARRHERSVRHDEGAGP